MCNLVRWFTHVRNLQPFIECFGELILCEKEIQIEFEKDEENIVKEAKINQLEDKTN
jgi:hypothetical protein